MLHFHVCYRILTLLQMHQSNGTGCRCTHSLEWWCPAFRGCLQEPVQPPVTVVPFTASASERTAITAARRNHPLFTSCALMILTEIMNSRLFTTVRASYLPSKTSAEHG